MNQTPLTGESRIALLERSLGRTRWAVAVLALGLLALLGTQLTRRSPSILTEVRTRRLVVIDDLGRTKESNLQPTD